MATAAVATCNAGRGYPGAELFIGRRALNKIMVHADYASAETCLPQKQGEGVRRQQAEGGYSQDYCGHVAEQNRTEQAAREYVKWTYQNGDDAACWGCCGMILGTSLMGLCIDVGVLVVCVYTRAGSTRLWT